MSRGRRITLWVVGILVGLVVLFYLFEWAGTALLDSGGTVGP